jgi:hypothetical protein
VARPSPSSNSLTNPRTLGIFKTARTPKARPSRQAKKPKKPGVKRPTPLCLMLSLRRPCDLWEVACGGHSSSRIQGSLALDVFHAASRPSLHRGPLQHRVAEPFDVTEQFGVASLPTDETPRTLNSQRPNTATGSGLVSFADPSPRIYRLLIKLFISVSAGLSMQ